MGWTRGVAVFAAVFCFGVMVAAIVYQLNTMGVVVDEYVTGTITIEDVMTLIVLLFALLGGILAVVAS